MIDYQQRISTVQQAMHDHDIDLMFVPQAANLFYLAGIRRQLEHGTDHNRYGDWLSGGYLGQEGPIHLVAARMGGQFWVNEAEGKPWVSGVRLINEPIEPKVALMETLSAFGLTAGKAVIAVDDRAWAQFIRGVQEILPKSEFVSANEMIAPMRMIKSAYEISLMQAASDLTDQVFLNVIPKLEAGVTEFEIATEIDYQFVTLGAEYTSFETGVSFIAKDDGGGGDTIRTGMRKLKPGDSIMFDFGGLIDGYASDFGRSAFFGDPTAEYQKVHDTVIKSQADAMAAMVAGQCTAAEANRIARKVIADAGYDDGFTHRLGHGIGVTVHEPPFLDGTDEIVLQENMVFTVEPSIVYRDRFANRIEDMVVVTSDGGKPMSKIERKLFIVD
jgi:Xaa-Pro aminopeptidase